MSEANIRKLGRKHAREPPKPAVITHFQFAFVLDGDAGVPNTENEEPGQRTGGPSLGQGPGGGGP